MWYQNEHVWLASERIEGEIYFSICSVVSLPANVLKESSFACIAKSGEGEK